MISWQKPDFLATKILGRRLFLRSAVSLAIILLGAVSLELWLAAARKADEAHNDLIRRLNSIEPYIIQALWRVDTESVRVAVQSIGDNPGVAKVSLRAQFRINDINESFERKDFNKKNCSRKIVRDYSTMRYQGLEIGSGVLNICFSDKQIKENASFLAIDGSLLKHFVIAAIMALVLFFLISRSIIQPIDQIIRRVRENTLLSGSPLQRDLWDKNDEIGELFDQLVEKETVVERSHKDDKLRLLGIMASGVAHDFNNVLAVIMGNAELLGQSNSQKDRKRVSTLIKATHTGAAVVRRLQLLSGKTQANLGATGINEIWKNVQSFVDFLITTSTSKIEVIFKLETDRMIVVDPGGLEAALLNLILNARDAVVNVEHPRIRVEANTVTKDSKDTVCISVSDNGTGIDSEDIKLVLEPFFTKKNKEGSGLGLAMVSEFMKRCGGRISIESELGSGTTVYLNFPAVLSPSAKLPSVAVSYDDNFQRSVYNILIVDDEIELAQSLSGQLTQLGYKSKWETDALQVMHDVDKVSSYDVIVSDVLLGSITGMDLYQHFKSVLGDQCPPVIFISGAMPESFSDALQKITHSKLIHKPFEITTLDACIHKELMSAQETSGTAD